METFILDPLDYEKLYPTPQLGPVRAQLPQGTNVIVAEEGEEIIGTWALVPLVHLEGFWISPEHQKKAGVGRALLRKMAQTAQEMGAKVVITGAESEEIEKLISKVGGVELPVKMFAINVERTP